MSVASFVLGLAMTASVAMLGVLTGNEPDGPRGVVRIVGIRGTQVVAHRDGDAIGFAENIAFELGRPIDPQALRTQLRIEPHASSLVRAYGRRVILAFRKRPSTAYTITVPGSVPTTDGGTLGEDVVLHVHTDAVPHVTPLRATPNEPYRYGTLAHPFPYSLTGENAERIVDTFAKAGVRFVRIEYPAAMILGDDKPNAQPDFSKLDAIAEMLQKRGITELPVLTQYTVPKYQARGKGYPAIMADAADFASFAGIVAAHLKRFPQIAKIEIFNEPNLYVWWTSPDPGSATDDRSGTATAAYMKGAYAAIKRANPALQIGGPALAAGGHDTDPRSFLEAMYGAGCRTGTCWDFLTVHNYRWDDPTYPVTPKQQSRWDVYKDLQDIAVRHGDPRPHVLLTEWGFSHIDNAQGFDPEVQAYFTALGFNLMLADPSVDGVVYVNVYNGGPANNFFAQTQLVRNDFSPLPGFNVFREFAGKTSS